MNSCPVCHGPEIDGYVFHDRVCPRRRPAVTALPRTSHLPTVNLPSRASIAVFAAVVAAAVLCGFFAVWLSEALR